MLEAGSLASMVPWGEVERDRRDDSALEEWELSREEGGVRLGVESPGRDSTTREEAHPFLSMTASKMGLRELSLSCKRSR